MYAAFLNKKLVLAVNEARLIRNKIKNINEEKYLCPRCHKRVILIMSQNKIAFFKHLLHYNKTAGEKEEHRNAKLLLKSAFTAAGLVAKTEVPLAAGQLRSDVLVSRKLALEVQCAPLSKQEFVHRHQLYKKIKILDLWIVGSRHYLTKKIKTGQLIFFRKNERWQDYYLEIDVKKNILRLKYNIKQAPISRLIVYQIATFTLDENGIKNFWQYHPNNKQYSPHPVSQKRYLQKQIKQKTKFGLMVATQMYQLGIKIDDLPESVFNTWRIPGELDQISQYLKNKDIQINRK